MIVDITVRNGYEDIVFLDDEENVKECAGFLVIGKTCEDVKMDGDKIVAIGKPKIRERIQNTLKTVALIHTATVISRRVEVGDGSVAMDGAVINSNTIIGKGCIINTGASVDHDCKVKDFVQVSVGAHVVGTCVIGERT